MRVNNNYNNTYISFCGLKSIDRGSRADVPEIAALYKDTYNKILDEGWTQESAENYINYNYDKQPDLFFVAKDDDQIKGYTFGYIKPDADGNHLICEDFVVDDSVRKNGVGKKIKKMLVDEAIKNYNVSQLEASTYHGENGMPMKWYEKLGWYRQPYFLIQAKPHEVSQNLAKEIKNG